MNLYYKMLIRQYKKRRNKKGGRNFFDAVFSRSRTMEISSQQQPKIRGMEAASNTQKGLEDFEASRKANVQRSMMAGEYSDLAKSLMKKKIRSKSN